MRRDRSEILKRNDARPKSAKSAAARPGPERRAAGQQTRRTSNRQESFKTVVFAVLIALCIRTFLVQAFRIPSGSMEDTLLVGDFLLVDKITYGAKIPGTSWRLPGLREPRRGDIIVFKDPRTNRDYIKRCIAVGGETIELRSNVVSIDGHTLEEPYKAIKPVAGPVPENFGPYRVKGKALFMMGDNRNNSQDSRYWNELDPGRVVGRAFVLYWSSDPNRSPEWVRKMGDSPAKGFLSLVLGRPRIGRVGTWLANDYTPIYAQGSASAAPAAASP
jgi:signal peptidase I